MNEFYIVKEYVDYYRFKNNLSRRSFCRQCGITLRELKDIEKNKKFNSENIFKVSQYIKVPVHYFVVHLANKDFMGIDKFLGIE